jgi:magnesium transporter
MDTELVGASHVREQKHHDITWVDVQSPDRQTLERLQHEYHLHPVHLNESIQKVQHTQVDREADYMFLMLHFPIFDRTSDRVDVGQVGIFLGHNFLITIKTAPSQAIGQLFDECQQLDEGHEEHCFKHGAAFILYSLIDRLLGEIAMLTDYISSELDDLEEAVFDDRKSDALQIGKVRQKIVRLRRVIGPKRFALQDLTEHINSFTGENMSKYYANNTKTANKLWEEIEEAKETVEIFKDADFTTSTEQTNKILAVLTIIFTLTIPGTLVGTLYGMNVDLPGGLVAGPWHFLGTYTTFIMAVVVSILAAGLMYAYFHRKKWF